MDRRLRSGSSASRLARACGALLVPGASMEEWLRAAVPAARALTRARRAAVLVAAGHERYLCGDEVAAAVVLRRSAARMPGDTSPDAGIGLTELATDHLLVPHDAAIATTPRTGARHDGSFDLVWLLVPGRDDRMIGVCCTLEPAVSERAAYSRLALLQALWPTLESTARARLRHGAGSDPRPAGAPVAPPVADTAPRAHDCAELLRRHYHLTGRERQVARLIHLGDSNQEIARTLGISSHTARHYTERVLAKLGIRSRAAIHGVLFEATRQLAQPHALTARRTVRLTRPREEGAVIVAVALSAVAARRPPPV